MDEHPGDVFTDYKIPGNFKKVVVGFFTHGFTRFNGITFYDEQGTTLLSLGAIQNPVETILDDDERIVGIASRNEFYAEHFDF